MNRSGKTTGDGDSADFGVAEALPALVALPELKTGALGVAVGGARAVALLLLVMAGEQDVQWDGDEEEEAGWMLVGVVSWGFGRLTLR
jgi:hypothetical protein